MNEADQLQCLAEAIAKLAAAIANERTYTITGAADWPMVLVLAGALCGVLGFMWIDLRNNMKENKHDCAQCKQSIWAGIDSKQDKG